MKPLLLLLLMAMCSCDNEQSAKVITSKDYSSDWFTQLPKGIVTYRYKHSMGHCEGHTTQDSCNKYQIGDTIK